MMAETLKKIPYRRVVREKGKSACIIAALFLTTVLFVVIFSALFFTQDALKEFARKNSFWTADAAFMVNDEQYEKIEKSTLVSNVSSGYSIGGIYDAGGYLIEIELVDYENQMAHWMNCYPTEGRMPQKKNEIVVSDDYLEEQGITYTPNKQIDVTYMVDGEEYTDSFLLVGMYEKDHARNVMLLSHDFYEIVKERMEQLGKDSDEILQRTVTVMFTSSGNLRLTSARLMEEIGFDANTQGFALNSSFSMADAGMGFWVVLGCILLFVVMVGYLFISNIFQIAVVQDTKFYGKLATIGVTEKEIKKLIHRENNLLYLMAVLPALAVGFVFSSYILPGILNSFFTFPVRSSRNIMVFVWSLAFSYFTLWVSERKPVKFAKKISPVEMRRFMGNLKNLKKEDDKSCLKKLSFRDFWGNRRKAFKIMISVAVSLLLAVFFYTIVTGFNEREYASQNISVDYAVAKESFFEINTLDRENIKKSELEDCSHLPGVTAQGGGAACTVMLSLPEEVWDLYDQIVGDGTYYNDYGEMLTYAYGLDDILLQKMDVKSGTFDLALFHTGDYVLVDVIYDYGDTCFQPGSSISIPFADGKEKSYTVMAVVELPYDVSYQSIRSGASNVYLPMTEWQERTQQKDYYMYTYDVEKEYQDIWDDALAEMIEKDDTLQYKSVKTEMEEAREFIGELKLVGLVLSAILASMGILNYINCMASGIYSRRKEFAILQSMGIKNPELIKSLIEEGMFYMLGSFAVGVALSVLIVYLLIDKILGASYLRYEFYLAMYLLFAVIGILAAVLVPWITYTVVDKKETFLERIRSCKD